MCAQIHVTFLIAHVFRDVVQILAPDDQRPMHLRGDNRAGQDATADGDGAGKRTFLI